MPEAVDADVGKIELIECEAVLDMYAAATAGVRSELGIAQHGVDGDALLLCRGIDILQFNRLVGFGVMSPARAESLDWALAELDRAGGRNWVVQVAEGDESLMHLCETRGLVSHPRTWAKFILGSYAVAASTPLRVLQVALADAAAFGTIAAGAYGLPPAAANWIAALVGRPRWHCLMAWDGWPGTATRLLRPAQSSSADVPPGSASGPRWPPTAARARSRPCSPPALASLRKPAAARSRPRPAFPSPGRQALPMSTSSGPAFASPIGAPICGDRNMPEGARR